MVEASPAIYSYNIPPSSVPISHSKTQLHDKPVSPLRGSGTATPKQIMLYIVGVTHGSSLRSPRERLRRLSPAALSCNMASTVPWMSAGVAALFGSTRTRKTSCTLPSAVVVTAAVVICGASYSHYMATYVRILALSGSQLAMGVALCDDVEQLIITTNGPRRWHQEKPTSRGMDLSASMISDSRPRLSFQFTCGN